MQLSFSGCERQRIVQPDDNEFPPLPPAGLLVEGAHDGYIFIGWVKNLERDLSSYVVYRGEGQPSAPFTIIDTLVNNYFIDLDKR